MVGGLANRWAWGRISCSGVWSISRGWLNDNYHMNFSYCHRAAGVLSTWSFHFVLFLLLLFWVDFLRRGGSGRVLFIWVSCTSPSLWSKHCYSDRCLLLRSLCFTALGSLMSGKTKFLCKQWSQYSLALSIAGTFLRRLCTFPLKIRFLFGFVGYYWGWFVFLLFICLVCVFFLVGRKRVWAFLAVQSRCLVAWILFLVLPLPGRLS